MIGTVCYATEQGLGHLAKWFHEHGVVTHPLLVPHPRHPHHPEWYPPGTPVVNPKAIRGPVVDEWLGKIKAAVFFETPFDWSLPDLCKARGVRTVLVPMHEWTPERPPAWFDKVISPSLLDLRYFPGSEFVPIPAAPDVPWELRTHARRYLHNAGHVGHREHKGTRQLLEAVKYIKSDLTITVRCQYAGMIEQMAREVGVDTYRRLRIESGYLPREKLFAGYDVYVAPEKLNGLSIPLQEAFAAGMLVMTTDRYPANAWLPAPPLIPAAGVVKARVSPGCYEVDESVVDPKEIAARMDLWYGTPIDAYSAAGLEWSIKHSWPILGPVWREAILS